MQSIVIDHAESKHLLVFDTEDVADYEVIYDDDKTARMTITFKQGKTARWIENN